MHHNDNCTVVVIILSRLMLCMLNLVQTVIASYIGLGSSQKPFIYCYTYSHKLVMCVYKNNYMI